MSIECVKDGQEIEMLKKSVATRKAVLQKSLSCFANLKSNQKAAIIKDIADTKERSHNKHQTLMHSRRVLIAELVSLFDLKRINGPQDYHFEVRENGVAVLAKENDIIQVINGSADDEAEYSIAGMTLPKKGNFQKYPMEDINTTVGYVIHMLQLTAYYLGVKLPYRLLRDKGSFPYATGSFSGMAGGRRPLHLDGTNVDTFTKGLAMLNYDIAYLCRTQGVDIAFHKVPNTLQNLYLCCNAAGLGR
ncbi:11640_t:CDS:2 [Paraglomus brasilianum]|uniref:Autophagy-related protein 14 n=1 Tax=Paraglomus brasilianum TaxID=144538 RepID=A0A9N9F0H8_9GLOM|nr:11640_t:CDS:2 [Paraglomus brasilianum]